MKKVILGLLGISMMAMNVVSAAPHADKHAGKSAIEKNARCKKCRGGK